MNNVQTDTNKPRSGFAIAALVLGIVAAATSFMPIINNASFFIALIGLILAIVAIAGIRKGKNSGKGLAVAGLVLSIVAGLLVLGTQAFYSAVLNEAVDQSTQQLNKMTGDATDDILGVDVEVTIGDYSISKDQYGLVKSDLPVTVTNLLKEPASFWINVEAVDANGSRINDDTVIVNDLGAGQSTKLDAFAFVSSDDYEAMKNASFNIISVSEI
ncbi:MAG TPA: DUF4190 domain-containing protein [Coriobacteriaceae bacterium]|nr:DUF4190 domain-containing protein [Coriobacteriaceae bacterium]